VPLQFRLVRQNAVQAAIQARIVDLAFFDLQQIVQHRGRIPALFNGQFAARRTETIDRQQRSHARPWHIGRFVIDSLFEETIQFEALPQIQPQKTGTELPGPFQSDFVQQHASHLRIIRRRRHMRWEEFQLLCFALIVEDVNGCQRACAELFSSPR